MYPQSVVEQYNNCLSQAGLVTIPTRDVPTSIGNYLDKTTFILSYTMLIVNIKLFM